MLPLERNGQQFLSSLHRVEYMDFSLLCCNGISVVIEIVYNVGIKKLRRSIQELFDRKSEKVVAQKNSSRSV